MRKMIIAEWMSKKILIGSIILIFLATTFGTAFAVGEILTNHTCDDWFSRKIIHYGNWSNFGESLSGLQYRLVQFEGDDYFAAIEWYNGYGRDIYFSWEVTSGGRPDNLKYGTGIEAGGYGCGNVDRGALTVYVDCIRFDDSNSKYYLCTGYQLCCNSTECCGGSNTTPDNQGGDSGNSSNSNNSSGGDSGGGGGGGGGCFITSLFE